MDRVVVARTIRRQLAAPGADRVAVAIVLFLCKARKEAQGMYTVNCLTREVGNSSPTVASQ